MKADSKPQNAFEWSQMVLHDVSKIFRDTRGDLYHAVGGVSITIDRGDFYCLLGPSGCGKSTVLNIAAGFEEASEGTLAFEGVKGGSVPIVGPGIDRSMVFQDVGEALFPWLNVAENIAFGPKLAGTAKAALEPRLHEYMKMVGLAEHAHKFPFELSGGMRQRVQIARALIMEPQILLMDEPFAALDAITKRIMQSELARIFQESHKTVIYVTHDIVEALLLGTRIAVMTAGPAATIKQEFEVDLPRPRERTSDHFIAMQRILEGLIYEEVEALRGLHEGGGA